MPRYICTQAWWDRAVLCGLFQGDFREDKAHNFKNANKIALSCTNKPVYHVLCEMCDQDRLICCDRSDDQVCDRLNKIKQSANLLLR